MNTWPSLTISITYSFGQPDTFHIVCICDPTKLSKGQEGSVSKVPTAAPTPIPTAAPTAEPTPVPTVFEQDVGVMWFAFRTLALSQWANKQKLDFRRARSRLYRSRIFPSKTITCFLFGIFLDLNAPLQTQIFRIHFENLFDMLQIWIVLTKTKHCQHVL